MDVDWSVITAGVALLIAIASLINSHVQGRNANKHAETANDIAQESLTLSKARLQKDDDAYIQPIRFDPGGNRVFFTVGAARSVAEAEFEFLNYANVGGLVKRKGVPAGEVWIPHGEFSGNCTLAVPPSRAFAATARWRMSPDAEWSTAVCSWLTSRICRSGRQTNGQANRPRVVRWGW